MDQHAADALVTAYEDLIPILHLPDPDDRHVLAAAIPGHANVIVTMNYWYYLIFLASFVPDALKGKLVWWLEIVPIIQDRKSVV